MVTSERIKLNCSYFESGYMHYHFFNVFDCINKKMSRFIVILMSININNSEKDWYIIRS
jgi:hypothetical protein